MAQPLMFRPVGTAEPVIAEVGFKREKDWVLRVKLMRRLRNRLSVLSGFLALVTIGSFAMAAPSDSDEAAAAAPTAVVAIDVDAGLGQLAAVPEEMAMVLVGTALLGVAAAVRRSA